MSEQLPISFDVGGDLKVEGRATTLHDTTSTRGKAAVRSFSAVCVSDAALERTKRMTRTFRETVLMPTLYEQFRNVGTSTVVIFGGLTLKKCAPLPEHDWDWTVNERILYDGTREVQSGKIYGYDAEFEAFIDNYDDIATLKRMVGKPYQLSVFGKPYRNCKLVPPITERKLGGRTGIMWKIRFTIKQDTSV